MNLSRCKWSRVIVYPVWYVRTCQMSSLGLVDCVIKTLDATFEETFELSWRLKLGVGVWPLVFRAVVPSYLLVTVVRLVSDVWASDMQVLVMGDLSCDEVLPSYKCR
jgi:hypothetical protein